MPTSPTPVAQGPAPIAGEASAMLSIVVPAFNEAEGIAITLGRLRAALPDAELIVVDDASTDDTGARARAVDGVRVATHAYNCGYGGALKTGMVLATRPYVAWFDADGEHRVEDLLAMADRLHRERLVAVIGQRRTPSATRTRALGKLLIRGVARMLEFRGGDDLNCGLRVFRLEVIRRYLFILPDGFSASLTSLMVMLERRYPIGFHSIETLPRIGASKVRLADGFATIALVVRMAMLFAPLRIFLRGGVLLTVAGVAYSTALALRTGAGLPVAGAIVTLAGLLLMAVGLIADQISQLRLIQLATLGIMPERPLVDADPAPGTSFVATPVHAPVGAPGGATTR